MHPTAVPGVREVSCTLDEFGAITALVRESKPDVVAYLAGITSVDQCEVEEYRARHLHAEVPAAIAEAVRGRAQFIYVSTDHLWDGTKSFLTEEEPLHPLNVYARTKALGERLVVEANPAALLLRTNFFGVGRPWRQSLSDWMLVRLQVGEPFDAFVDAWFTPISVPLLCRSIVIAVGRGLTGVYHLCGAERLTKHEFALRLGAWHALATNNVREGHLSAAPLKAPRPADMSLSTAKFARAVGMELPDLASSFRAAFGPPARQVAAHEVS